MKKIFLLLTVFALIGCKAAVAKSDYYNAIDLDSPSDTVEQLSEATGYMLMGSYETEFKNRIVKTWELGIIGSVLILSEETNVLSVVFKDYELDLVETLISDYEIEITEELKMLLNKDGQLFDEYGTDSKYSKEKHVVLKSDEITFIIKSNFGYTGNKHYQMYDVYIIYDKELSEVLKQSILENGLN